MKENDAKLKRKENAKPSCAYVASAFLASRVS